MKVQGEHGEEWGWTTDRGLKQLPRKTSCAWLASNLQLTFLIASPAPSPINSSCMSPKDADYSNSSPLLCAPDTTCLNGSDSLKVTATTTAIYSQVQTQHCYIYASISCVCTHVQTCMWHTKTTCASWLSFHTVGSGRFYLLSHRVQYKYPVQVLCKTLLY